MADIFPIEKSFILARLHKLMETKILEEKVIQRPGTIKANCHYCNKPLLIPKGIELEPRKDYGNFYISSCKIPYCNSKCFNDFTED